MNVHTTVSLAAGTTAVAVCDDLVVEELTESPAEDFLPGTCICWNDALLAS